MYDGLFKKLDKWKNKEQNGVECCWGEIHMFSINKRGYVNWDKGVNEFDYY